MLVCKGAISTAFRETEPDVHLSVIKQGLKEAALIIMSQILNILSWVLINPLWLATQTSGGTSSSSGSHPVQSLKMPFSSSFFCTLSCHSAMPLPGFELFPLQKNTADSFLRLQPFSLFTHKCLTPQEVPLPTHTGNRLALRYLQQKSLPCTSEVSFSSGKGNENH